MNETDQRREDRADVDRRASELAYARGRRDAEIDSRLDSHEKRLAAINGSIEKHARNAEALHNGIQELGEKIGAVVTTLQTQATVEADRVQQVKDANEKQISNRTFWLGVATICTMILIAILKGAV